MFVKHSEMCVRFRILRRHLAHENYKYGVQMGFGKFVIRPFLFYIYIHFEMAMPNLKAFLYSILGCYVYQSYCVLYNASPKNIFTFFRQAIYQSD